MSVAPTTLGTEPIGKLLRQYAMPAIIAMTASSLYNLVDSIFVGRGCGALAFSGLAVTFPLMNILAAFGSLVGVGGSTLISIKLGQKDYDSAQLVLGNVVLLNLVIGAVIGGLGLMFLEPILYFFGASEQTLPYAGSYMVIILVANFFTHLYYGLNGVLRSSGHPKLAMNATIVAVMVNVVLDPLFIFVLGMGVRGVAVATVISQFVAIVWQVSVLCNTNEVLHFKRDIFHFDKRIVTDLLAIGLSPFLMNLAGCAVVVVINNQLKRYGGDLAIGAYGVINRVTFIFCMIVMGLNQGMQPISGYNYGAQRYDRMLEVFRQTSLWATGVTTLLFICAEFFPGWMVRVFSADEGLVAIAVPGMRIVCAVFFLNGYQMVTGNFFTSIGMAKMSIFLSLTRQVLYLIPFALLLPIWMGINGVWYSMCISDVLACITSAIILTIYIRRFRHMHTLRETETINMVDGE
ncbi:MAG: MATE family efflux transporter [Paludibacter sp.]|nr:MATE family efflux transporter [Bacteroidales bacterium]MCM1068595.1 MATE family efflux transporter [Prevotella sp.]MCM1353259.1 MATE family efflux transporter [Bacteroides sp.]MCM1442333.1 MATE family efflux transporter [Muribaculum sp.]MCM1481152.1 MATE family efflux transporter [Paludibacter sp.]